MDWQLVGAKPPSTGTLLPKEALRGLAVGISVSETADLSRLGLAETHLRLLLGEVTRTVLLSGGSIVYGGRLDPNGYTAFLWHEVERYVRPNEPLVACLPWSVHRAMAIDSLRAARQELGLNGRLVCLDLEGVPIDPEHGRVGDQPEPVDPDDVVRGLTAMRRYLAEVTDARLFVGGKREGFQGRMPGVLEEALFAIEAKQPLYLAGGFGGVVGDLVRALGVPGTEWLAPLPLEEGRPVAADWLSRLPHIDIDDVVAVNGLTEKENERLATAYRPSEIASLVAAGLGRRAISDASKEDRLCHALTRTG